MVSSCGLPCVQDVFQRLAAPLLVAASVVFFVAGLTDLWLQNWFFQRDQRMSKTEAKRERKDMEGDPTLRRERRRLIREAADGPARLGVRQAMLLVHDGSAAAVGLRFQRGEMLLPLVVCRGRGERALTLMAEAATLGIVHVRDDNLARDLARRTPPGSPVPEDTFRAVATLLSQAGLV